MNFTDFSDSQLYQQCKKYGGLARYYRQKFAGLLPEVLRRRLYKRRGFASLEEFAAKLGGMSREATQKVLRLARVLEDKPALLEQLENGTVGWSKLETVAYVATKETDKTWANRIASMPKIALQTMVAAIRGGQTGEKITAGGKSEPEKHAVTMYLTAAVEKKLRQFQQKLEKERRETLDWDAVMGVLLEKARSMPARGEKAPANKAEPALTHDMLAAHKEKMAKELPMDDGRYIPQKVRRLLQKEFGSGCTFPQCREPSTVIHHTKRFALIKNHDPRFLAPLCKKHHTIAHSGLIKNEQKYPSQWQLRVAPDETVKTFPIDQRVWKYASAPSC